MTALSRRFEFQADEFASKTLGRGEKLAAALVKFEKANLFSILTFSKYHFSLSVKVLA